MHENENPQIEADSSDSSNPNWFKKLLNKLLPTGASLTRKILVIGVPLGIVLTLATAAAVYSAVVAHEEKKIESSVAESKKNSGGGIPENIIPSTQEPASTPSASAGSDSPSENTGSGTNPSGGSSSGGSPGSGSTTSSGGSTGGSSGGSNGGGSSSGGNSGGCALPHYPSASCTGWQPTGVTLSAYTGPLTITAHGTVIDGKDIQACLTINANDVVIKRSKVSCGSWAGLRMYGTNGLIEDTEVNMLGFTGANCLTGANYIGRRINCHNTGDGIRLGSNVTIEDSFVHGLVTAQGSHNDGMQTLGGTNITIRHNSIENPFTQTSCIILGHSSAPLNGVLIENNLFNGGGYTVYGGGTDSAVSGVKFINNRFKRGPSGFYPNGGFFGPVAHYDGTRPGNQWSGNVWDDNGDAIVR